MPKDVGGFKLYYEAIEGDSKRAFVGKYLRNRRIDTRPPGLLTYIRNLWSLLK